MTTFSENDFRPGGAACDWLRVELWTDALPQPEFKGRPVVRFIDGTREALQAIYSEKKN